MKIKRRESKNTNFKREVMALKYALLLLSEPLEVVRNINRARSPSDALLFII